MRIAFIKLTLKRRRVLHGQPGTGSGVASRPGMNWLCVALALMCGWSPVYGTSSALELRYEAHVAGAMAGTARVVLTRQDNFYSVAGRAATGGLMETFNPWRAQFQANGGMVEGVPQIDKYHYVESDNRKKREVTVANGQLRVVKNGRLRAEIPALPGLDILSALFIDPSCVATLDLHTGRHGYQLTQTPRSLAASTQSNAPPPLCAYKVRDDDGDSYEVVIAFTEVAGIRIPRSLEVSGVLNGRLKLVDYVVTPTAETLAEVPE